VIGNEQNADEVKAHRMKTLGPELGLVYTALYTKCVLLHVKWRQYLELFGTKPERLDLLNRSAPGFFRIVQDTFLDDTFLHLGRLTEKPNFGKRKTPTIRSLPALISDSVLQSEIMRLIKEPVKATKLWTFLRRP